MDETEKALRAEKNDLLDTIQRRVNNHIVGSGRHCIDLVERDSEGKAVLTWDLSDLDDFAKVLIRFLRKRRSKSGRTIDSALTDPILVIVKEEYKAFYDRQKDNIASGILLELASDDVKLRSFIDRLSQITLKKLTAKAREQVVDLITDQIKESMSQGALHQIGQHIGHVAATAAGTQVATIVAHLLIKLLAMHIGVIVSKVLASTALHNIIMLLGKKLIIGVVSGAVLNFLALHFGAALASSSILWVVIPIITAYILYKIATFPEDLGKEVSKEVRRELDKAFDSMNKTVLEAVFQSVFSGNDLVDAISKDPEFQDAMRTLGEKVDPTLKRLKGR